jgi:hypothetical protein
MSVEKPADPKCCKCCPRPIIGPALLDLAEAIGRMMADRDFDAAYPEQRKAT